MHFKKSILLLIIATIPVIAYTVKAKSKSRFQA